MMGKLETLTVPTELGEWLEDREHEIGIGCELFTLIEDLRKSYYGNEFASAADSFIRKHKKELIEVIIGTREYEVEEQKYYVIDKEDNILLIRGYGGIGKANNLKITNSGGGALKLTEQEIKDYDPRYWAFAEPVE